MANARAEELKGEGNTAFSAGDYDKAIELFSEAISLDPDNHIYFSNRSAAFCKKGEFMKAVQDADITINLKPEWARGYARKAAAFQMMKQYSNAAITYLLGLEKCPGDASLQKQLEDLQLEIQMNQPDINIVTIEAYPVTRVRELAKAHTGDEVFPAYGTADRIIYDADRMWNKGIQQGLEDNLDGLINMTNAIIVYPRACRLDQPVEPKLEMFGNLMMKASQQFEAAQAESPGEILSAYKERLDKGGDALQVANAMSANIRGPVLMSWFCMTIGQFGDALTPVKHCLMLLEALHEERNLLTAMTDAIKNRTDASQYADPAVFSKEFLSGLRAFLVEILIGGYLMSREAFEWALPHILELNESIIKEVAAVPVTTSDPRHKFLFGGANRLMSEQVQTDPLKAMQTAFRAQAYMNRGWYYIQEKKYEEASGDYELAIPLILKKDQKQAIARWKYAECSIRALEGANASFSEDFVAKMRQAAKDAEEAMESSRDIFGDLPTNFPAKVYVTKFLADH
eukprot:TRINITY_DN1349_c0_g1::TRINITY_DN1349_c0_g1_i1::g.20001::m.20001 TRINITY_DN1349_c0_g1::TRINITY_DN1349_c0_g1_i1::g.20001  ORF type:complete len:514 (+),score=181.13,sp/Q4R8N7/STIP1_MACFA/40.43/1e-25,sp/Q4R8N7/STIP1_MACFA/40.00/8e-14,TPR_11/PF13414.1/8.8e-18,TPR_11/PF13414.1/0.0035,TPR_11/PF13414.1/3.2,TPR_11/PF13414.1/0.0079,TPR_1/PF00515.23/9.2e-08,TPR_1/PF00515.23/2.9e+02,TPR_1/PF00515.23/2.6,TPR_1/PF00515.23/0.00085,TPR_2/PF07719.12/6.1e-07,TPR_2/PF07719.12/5.4e+03,TPR_2/PF07719.12/25,TPR_2/PF0